jgi:hypothetical protein
MTSISGLGSLQLMQMGMTGSRKEVALTDDQKSTVEDILSQYDPENMTEEDAQEIFDAFREAGIEPGESLKETVEAAGFDLEAFKPEGPQGPPPPPPSTSSSSQKISASSLQSLQTILNQYDLSNLSAEDEESLISQFQEAGLLNTGSLFSIEA